MIPDEVEICFWPLRVVVRGNRAINALRWPIAIALVTLTLTLGIALVAAGIFRLNEIQNLSGFTEPLTAPARDTGKRLGVARLLSASLD